MLSVIGMSDKRFTLSPKCLNQSCFQELKKAFAQGVYFCREQIKINQLLVEGFKAAQ